MCIRDPGLGIQRKEIPTHLARDSLLESLYLVAAQKERSHLLSAAALKRLEFASLAFSCPEELSPKLAMREENTASYN
jgi:hypothetical protein